MPKVIPAILLLIVGVTLHADLVVEQKIEGPAGASKSTMKIKGDRARMDTDGPTGKITALLEKSGRLVTYVHESKLALVTSVTESQKGTSDLLKKAGAESATPETFTNTGETEKIGAWSCEVWVRHTPAVTFKEWRAKDVPNLKGKQVQMAVLAAIQGMGIDVSRSADFHVVKSERNDAKGTTTMSVTRISEEDVPESAFTPPEGYREMTVPAP